MGNLQELQKIKRRNRVTLVSLMIAVAVLAVCCLFAGSSNMTVAQGLQALLGKGSPAQTKIIWNIRIPRVLAAIVAGAGLSVAGLIMQSTLGNAMASPSTLGVSNGAVFGANLSIIVFAGGFLSTGNNALRFDVGANPYATSILAFVFAMLSVLLILGLCSIRAFSPNVVVLAGIAIGAVWTAATTTSTFRRKTTGCAGP